jgi:hypothetical protein
MGWMRAPGYNTEGLKQFINDLPPGIDMVEIGSFEGDSAELFLESGKIARFLSVDAYSDDLAVSGEGYNGDQIDMNDPDRKGLTPIQAAAKRFKQRIIDRYAIASQLRVSSAVASQLMSWREFDMVYIDGNHLRHAVAADIMCWLPRVKVGGLIAGHDYNLDQYHNGVVEAVNAIFGKPERVYPDHSWFVHRVP